MRKHEYELEIARILDNKLSLRETLVKLLIVSKGPIKEILPLQIGRIVDDLKDLYMELRERN
ncbi:MAG: hypothetical protein DRJ35_02915 [Thermoprotei archaeon]|nr:MAG: hypothetical protein DRJ35_02915 [Thermoprotei archaeon]